MEFTKYHGLGNDFVIVNDFASKYVKNAAEIARHMCDRHFGIGADGLVLITKPQELYMMRIFNADGSEPEMCGNAIRCVADHLFVHGLANGSQLKIETKSGIKEIHRENKGYSVDMGQPQFPQKESVEVIIENVPWQVYPVSMGNPHGVVFVEELAALDFHRWGPLLENHPIWPAKANIEFAEVRDTQNINVKVWERGVGPTLACGTGACATAVCATRLGKTESKVNIMLPGGELRITWNDDGHVWMHGPAVSVFAGVYAKGN